MFFEFNNINLVLLYKKILTEKSLQIEDAVLNDRC